MMKNLDRLLAMSLGLAACSGAAFAQDDPYDNRWYTGVSGGLIWADGSRQVEGGNDYHYGINVGRFFSPSFSLDLRVDRYTLEFDEVTPAPSNRNILQSYGLVGRYHFLEGEATRPYLLAGLGIQEHENAYDDGRDIYASVGAGIMHRYSDRWSMRLEGELRHDNDRDTFDGDNGFDDFLLTLGFNYSFGERPRAAAPAPAPEPQPVRRPAPAPEPAPEPPPEPEVIFEFSAEVAFGLNSAELQPAAIAELNDAIELLSMHPELTGIQVAGHTCDLGAADHNQGLSERRAQAVHDYLVEHGIDDDRLSVRGFGEDRPKVPNTSERNRSDNRRVELVVIERSDR